MESQQIVLLGNVEEFKNILNFIKQTRLNNKLSQEELAKALKITQSKYARIENGTQPLTIDFLCNFLNQFRLSMQILEEKNGFHANFAQTGNGNIVTGNMQNSSIHADNRQYYSESPDVLRAQIAVLDERIKEKDAQIKEKDAQINKLLDILKPGK